MPRYTYRGGRGVRAATVLRLGRPVGWGCTCALAFFIIHPCRDQRRRTDVQAFTHPDNMLRSPSRLTDSSAPAEILSVASGRCGRRVRACFIISSRPVCPFFRPYSAPETPGGGRTRCAVLRGFRGGLSRFGPSDSHSGNSAVLVGIREGGRAGNPVPPCSPFSDISYSYRRNRDIRFKSRSSDRRHAYF